MTNFLLNLPSSPEAVPHWQIKDKQYFIDNPNHRFYLRPKFKDEFAGPEYPKVYLNEKINYVIVFQVNQSLRMRYPIPWYSTTRELQQDYLETLVATALLDDRQLRKKWDIKFKKTISKKIRMLHPLGYFISDDKKLSLNPEQIPEMVLNEIITPPPALFEFNTQEINHVIEGKKTDIYESAREAWQEDLLHIPFGHCVYILNNEWLYLLQSDDNSVQAYSLVKTEFDCREAVYLKTALKIHQTLKIDSLNLGMDGIEEEAKSKQAIIERMLILSLLLATRGIQTQVKQPHKRQVKRYRKANMPILPQPVTQVRLQGFSSSSVGSGHHASPRPHVRRGHIRHFHDSRFKGHKPVWISPMLVAATAPEDMLPKHYKVK
jgi:hypothetical protein